METLSLTDQEFSAPIQNLPQEIVDAIEPYKAGLLAIVSGENHTPPRLLNELKTYKAKRKKLVEAYRAASTREEQQDCARQIRECNTVLRGLRSSTQPGAIWREEDWLDRNPRPMASFAEKNIEETSQWVQSQWDRHELPKYELAEDEKEDDLDPVEWEARFIKWAIRRWRYAYESFGGEEARACITKGESEAARLEPSDEPEILLSDPRPEGFVAINFNDMRRLYGAWKEETEDEKLDRASKLMTKALHKKGIEGWTPEEQEVYQAAVQRLHKHYIRWRRRRLTYYYFSFRQANLMDTSEKGKTEFLRSTGKNTYEESRMPNYRFFLEKILPTVVAIANSVEEMEQIGRDAIEVLDSMMIMTFSRGTRIETDAGLMRDFFEDHDPSGQELSKTHISTHTRPGLTHGQFKYFYPRFGKEFTKVIALHNGWRSDIYYGDGFNEFLPYGAITHGYGRIAQLVGPENRDQVFRLLHKHLPWRQVNAISQMAASRQLPGVEAPASIEGRVLTHLLLEEGDHYLRGYDTFMELTGRGLDSELAACVRPEELCDKYVDWNGVFGEYLSGLTVRAIPGIEPPARLEDIQALIDTMGRVNQLVHTARRTKFDFFRGSENKVKELPQSKAVERVNFSVVDKLNAQMAEIDRLSEKEELKVVFRRELDELRKEVKRVTSLAFFRRVMGIGLIDKSLDARPSSFLRETNPVTQMAISSAAFMVSIGALKIPGLSERVEPVRVPVRALLSAGEGISPDVLEQILHSGNIEAQLRRNAATILPVLEELVIQDRMTRVGTMAGGAKLHTNIPMDGSLFQDIREMFGLGQTSFRLIHADESLIIPPLPGNLEPKLLVQTLGHLGVINEEHPELQTTMAGREWPQEVAGIVGSSVLLATQRGVRYKPGAFSTTHDGQTDARIMARDAGVMKKDMPFHLDGIEGRTDKLGGRHYNDIDLYRVLGTLANHGLINGPFAPIWRFYEREYLGILKEHNLLDALSQSDWVYDRNESSDGDLPKNHEAMIARFTDAWFQSVDVGHGIIDKVEGLIGEAMVMMEEMRPVIEQAMPGELEKLRRF